MSTLAWNTDGSTTVSNTIGEGIHGSGLVLAGETELVVGTINSDMFLVSAAELLESSLDVHHTTWFSHLLSGDVGVKTGTIPVTWDWLGVEGDLDTEFFGDTVEEVAGHPEVVTHLDTDAWTNLEFPLRWKDLGVDTRDLDTGVQARLVVSLDDITAVDVSGTDSTVVWTLWAWESTLWPAIWPSSGVKESVFLLKTEPWDLLLVGLHESIAFVAVVVFVWSAVWVPGLAHDEDVWKLTDWVWEDGYWSEVNIRVPTWSLTGGGTIKVPFWEIFWAAWLLEESLGLGAKIAGGVDPDVFSHDVTILWERGELFQVRGVGDDG